MAFFCNWNILLSGPDGARSNLAPSGVGVVPAGPYHPSVMSDKIPQYGALMPPFVSTLKVEFFFVFFDFFNSIV